MLNQIETFRPVPPTRPRRTVAVVSRNPHRHVLEILLGAMDHDVVVVESMAHAYSHIKRVAPDLVIVCLSSDDPDGCQVLSMLTLDSDTARIPLVTYLLPPYDLPGEADVQDTAFSQLASISLN